MGINAERAATVRGMLDEYECITTELVQAELHCGRAQAARAIRQARYVAADDGRRVSYATAANDYTVALEGDGPERVWSYVSRLQSITTQRKNAGHVMSASVDHGRSSKVERVVSAWATAGALEAEAEQIKLDAFKELLSE